MCWARRQRKENHGSCRQYLLVAEKRLEWRVGVGRDGVESDEDALLRRRELWQMVEGKEREDLQGQVGDGTGGGDGG